MRPEEEGRLVLGTAPIVDQGSAPEHQRLGGGEGVLGGGGDAALGVAGLQIHQLRRGQRVVRIVKGAQARIQNAFRQRAVRRDREPFLVRVVDEIAVGDRFAQPEIGKE